MTTHNDLLDPLLAELPHQVFLVARYEDNRLGLGSDPTLRVFLPDFHWMSKECLARYTGGYEFNGNRELPNGKPGFAILLNVLESLHDAEASLEIFQLGDRFDLWREVTSQDTLMSAYQRVRNDAAIAGLATRLNDLQTRYVRGNHDAWLANIEDGGFTEPRSATELETANGAIYLTHGHRYDNIEAILPDDLQVFFVGLCPKIKPGTKSVGPFTKKNHKDIQRFLELRKRPSFPRDLYPTVRPDGARPIKSTSDLQNLQDQFVTHLDVRSFSHGTGDRNDFEHISYLRFADQIRTFEFNHPSDHRIYVIGHTHHARILVDALPGGSLVLMDCGGWIEQCTIAHSGGTHHAPSAQVGVQCGNDLRIYQLGVSLAA
jgi:UDP-2,3-diacylglucosamine pyrophosphatase LpxH